MRQARHDWLRLSLLIPVIIGTVLRFLAGIFDNPLNHLFSDPARHWDNAVNFFNPGLMGGCDPILYQVYLMGARAISAGNSLIIGILTGLLSATMPWLYYRAARSFGIGATSAMFCWAAIAWLPSFFVIYRYFMMETLLLPLIGLGLWMTGRAIQRGEMVSFLTATSVWTLAILTKAQAIPIALICWGYALWPLPRKLPAVGFSLCILFLLALPNAVRSKEILGYFAPFGSGYIACIMHESGATHTRFETKRGSWRFSSPSCYIEPLEPINRWRIKRGVIEVNHEVRVDLSRGRHDWVNALSAAHRTPWEWCVHGWENVILFLFAPSWPDSGRDHLSGWLNHHSRWLWAPLLFQVVVGNFSLFLRRQFDPIPVATSVILLFLMFQNSFTMEGRYRKPLEPLLILNVIWLWSPAGKKGRRASVANSESGHLGASRERPLRRSDTFL